MRFVNSPLMVESYLRGQLNKLSQDTVWLLSRGLGGLRRGSGDTSRREVSIKNGGSYGTPPPWPGHPTSRAWCLPVRHRAEPYRRAWKHYPMCALVQGTKAPKKALRTICL